MTFVANVFILARMGGVLLTPVATVLHGYAIGTKQTNKHLECFRKTIKALSRDEGFYFDYTALP